SLHGNDYFPDEPRFGLHYYLLSMERAERLHVKVRLAGDAPQIASVVDLFPTANFQEREVYDMFGVEFDGHPDPTRILMPEDYVHTGIEKSCEDQAYWKVIPFVERMDYLSYYFNAMAYCNAVEKLLDLEVPARAQYLRVIHLELNRIASHLFWLATCALDLGA